MKLLLTGILALLWTGVTAQEVLSDSVPTVELEELTVKASNIVNNATGYTVSLTNDKITIGKTGSQVLPFLPGVTEENGGFNINGVPASEITIDGRTLRNLNELSDLSADQIQSVEVRYVAKASRITDNPGGSINIKLKKAPKAGFFGNLGAYATVARKSGLAQEGLSGRISAKTGILSIYESIGLNGSDINEFTTNTFTSPSSTESTRLKTDNHRKYLYNILALGFDLSPNHSLSLNWTFDFEKYNYTDCLQETKDVEMDSRSRFNSNNLNLSYSGRFNEHKSGIEVSGEWYRRKYRRDQQSFNNPEPIQFPYQNRTDLLKFEFDFDHRFPSACSFSAGAVFNSYRINNESGERVEDQRISAYTPLVYVSAQGNIQALKYYAGLNWQMNNVRVEGEKRNRQQALNPTLQLTLPFGTGNSLFLNYRRSLADIPYDALVAKQNWSDPYTYSVGNPNLKAPNEHLVSFGIGLLKGSLNLSATYIRENNDIFWETFNDSQLKDVTYLKPINLRGLDIYALRAGYRRTLFSVWTLKATGRVSFLPENQTLDAIKYDRLRIRQYYSLSNNLSFSNGWGGYVNAFLEPTYNVLDQTYYTAWQVDCSVYKSFLNNSLDVVLGFTPLGRRRAYDRRTADSTIRLKYTTPIQYARLSLTWKFSGGKKDIDPKIRQASLEYQEMKGTL